MSSPKKNKAFINEQTTMITSNVNATAVYNDDEVQFTFLKIIYIELFGSSESVATTS